MKANNLSISIPYKGCDKNCEYCVSKMTGLVESDLSLFRRNYKKVKNIATMSEASSVSITGKGEPMLNFPLVVEVLKKFEEFPTEIQTNGVLLSKKPELLNDLYLAGLDVVAISIDTVEQMEGLKKVIETANVLGLTVRYTFNITDKISYSSFKEYVEECKEYGIHQFSFRKITVANFTVETKVHEWIKEHTNDKMYSTLIEQFKKENYRHLRNLPYGAKLYDVEEMSFTFFDYCIQDNANENEIRSLIFMENGHLYTSWNSEASRII